jgi:hypothetical protein
MRVSTIVGMLTILFAGCGGDDKATIPIPRGPCCTPEGSCVMTVQADCLGIWTQGGSCMWSSCGHFPPSSPANVLANLRTAYEDRDIEDYERLFAEDFTFVFSPASIPEPHDPTPAQWGRNEEFTSTENMFRDELVDRVSLEWVIGVPEHADSVMYGPRAWKVKVDTVNLQVDTRSAAGVRLILQVPGTTEMFYFRQEPSRLASDGRPSWFIFRWEDQPILGLKVDQMSWGDIKYWYR